MASFDFTQSTALARKLGKTGRFPSLKIQIYPLDYNTITAGIISQPVEVARFISYQFSSSIIIPVDTFQFTFAIPATKGSIYKDVKEGDIVIISADDSKLMRGYIESVDIEVTADGGEKVTVTGKDFLGYFEYQTAISIDDKPIYFDKCSIKQAVGNLCHNTRIQEKDIVVKDDPGIIAFGTEIGESKLAALQRCVDPLNLLFWMDEAGKLVIGKPDFSARSSGKIVCNKSNRESNVTNIRARRESTTIPNIIVAAYSGQDQAQQAIKLEQRIMNPAKGPLRLLNNGHRIPQLINYSFPNPSDSNASKAASLNLLQTTLSNMAIGYAAREFAKQNMKELAVEATVGGHYNESGDPYVADTVYDIDFDRGGVKEAMYLHSVHYSLSEDGGQFTRLEFCKLYTCIVANNTLAGVASSSIPVPL
jgi:prophage tail gpP-like protein